MQISFGAKIPVCTFNIYDKRNAEFVKATMYEIDCSNKNDIKYIDKTDGIWRYKNQIREDARKKYKRLTNIDNFWYIRKANEPFIVQDNQFFSIESPNKEVVCLCETEQWGEDTDIVFIESSHKDRYKYAGQAMLASIAKNLSDMTRNITVKIATYDAISFYTDACGFKRSKNSSGYEINRKEINEFVQRFEEKTEGKILDYKQ